MKRGVDNGDVVSGSTKRVTAPAQVERSKLETMLAGTEEESLKRWGELTEAQLDAELTLFRERVAQVQAELSRVGTEGTEHLAFKSQLVQAEAAELAAALPDNGLVDWAEPIQKELEEAAGAEVEVEAEEGMEEGNVEDIDPSEWMVPDQCIPIHTNVTTFDWRPLYNAVQFDCIMMDPPWALATANPTRGVSLGYSQLADNDISRLPIPKLQKDGLLFVWVINAKYKMCLDLFKQWGYEFVDEIVWVKLTTNRRLAKSHGFYLQHAKEVCLVAKKGNIPINLKRSVGSDVIMRHTTAAGVPGGDGGGGDSERRGQSQKPTEIYELIEELVPGGKYLEIFARKNNLRNFWVSVGNEVTGTGAPEEDLAAVQGGAAPVGAVYGAAAGKTRS